LITSLILAFQLDLCLCDVKSMIKFFFQRKAHDLFDGDYDEESTMLEDTVLPNKATVLSRNSNKSKLPQSGSVAIPAVIRAGGQGPSSYHTGNMGDEQFSNQRGLQHSGHQPPLGRTAHIGEYSAGQKALIKNLDDGRCRKPIIEELLNAAPEIPVYGADPVSFKNHMHIHCSLLTQQKRVLRNGIYT